MFSLTSATSVRKQSNSSSLTATEFTWRHVTNFSSTIAYRRARREYASGSATARKPFSIVIAGKDAPAPGVHTAFALQRGVLDVANGYFRAFSLLTHCQVWHNLIAAGAPSQSQLWHRDPEDRHSIKLFLYLTDVDEGAGALRHARGSHVRPNEIAPHARLHGGTARSTDAEMAKLIRRRSG